MNVLLICPEFPDTFWSFKHALKFLRRRATLPPLGLLTIGAMLPAGWNKRLIDLNVGQLTEGDLAWADCAFVGAMIVQTESSRRVIARCNRAGVKVVAGGPLFTGTHEQFQGVDHFVLNEAEITLPRFLADFEKGCAKRVYATEDLADLSTTPAPSWGLADLNRYAFAGVQYSRGCPYNCEFCNVTALFGRRPRNKSADQVIGELDSLHKAGWRGPIFFVDDNLIGSPRRVKEELLPALIDWQKRNGPVALNAQVSINVADDEALMEMLVKAGFDTVFIGIETPDNDSLAECSKTQNRNRDLIADVKRIHRAGLQVQGGFIVGFDSDTPTIFQRQIDFIQNSGIVTAMVGLLQAVPGTRLYERMANEGRLLGLPSGDNVDGTTNIVPAMGMDALYEGYKSLLGHIYSPKRYYQRLKAFLREYRPSKMPVRLDWEYVMAFVRSMYSLGVVGKERFQYWKLLLWASIRRPNLFPLAVTLAIYGHHYRKVCELRNM